MCRRVCVLRERGQTEEAERLRSGPLTEMVAGLQTADETGDAVAQRLASIFALEEERVANASVVAELLLPLLSSQSQPFVVPPGAPTAAASARSPTPPAPPHARGNGGIADFIDDMIAQEGAPGHEEHPTRRHAS